MSQYQPKSISTANGAADEFPIEALRAHQGCWAAFSPDGRRLVASAATMAALEALVRAAGENPEDVLLELVPDGAFVAAGLELS